MQTILLGEAFGRFRQREVGIKTDAPTTILDVSCGPGIYSATWTSQVSSFLPQGMEFHCTDYKGGICKDGTPYTTATMNAIRTSAQDGKVRLAGDPVGVEADLFSGSDPIITTGKVADILHWSHSGYHVVDALGDKKDDPAAITAGLNTAIDKMWAALGDRGLMFSIHQTGDTSDGLLSEMAPISKRYLGTMLDDIPARITTRIGENGGSAVTVNFATPLKFPIVADTQWDSLKDPSRWDYLDSNQARILRLLSFIAHDFSDSQESGLEKLARMGKLEAFIDEYKEIVKRNGGHVYNKCAFQMIAKSPEIAQELGIIADELRSNMSGYLCKMDKEMSKAARQK